MNYFEKELDRAAIEEPACPYGLCDGSGLVEQGMHDEIVIKNCLCYEENGDQG
jgi:hypothetical protein